MPTISRNWIWILLAYLLVMAATGLGLWSARGWAIETFDTPDEQQNWGDWQQDTQARQDAQQIPAERRGHTSAEPPMLILLRDYFIGIAVTASVLATFLFAFLVFVLRGASRTGNAAADAR